MTLMITRIVNLKADAIAEDGLAVRINLMDDAGEVHFDEYRVLHGVR